jgi:hypothetical protein
MGCTLPEQMKYSATTVQLANLFLLALNQEPMFQQIAV